MMHLENVIILKIYHLLETSHNIMKRRVILLIILAITILSGMSFVSLLWYFDPYAYKILAVMLLSFCFTWFFWGIITLTLYFIKKIYFRGDVGMFHVLSSMRQWLLVCAMILGTIYVLWLWIPILLPIILIIAVGVFFELFIQNL
jgi:hypothetical protein